MSRAAEPAADVNAKTEAQIFSGYAARCALRGWQAWRSNPDDGVVRYFLGRWDRVLVLASLPEVERFLERAGIE